MLTKRTAIVALFSGVIAKMAHADDPNWKDHSSSNRGNTTISIWNKPTAWTVNLDQMTSINVLMEDKSLSITAKEIFEALSLSKG
jgi:hypothetical protein